MTGLGRRIRRVLDSRAPRLRRAMAVSVIAVFVVPTLAAGAPVAPTLVPVSGLAVSPFADCAADLVDVQHSFGLLEYPNSEVEPYVAVNPTNPLNLIAVWQQDRWDIGGGSRGNLAGVSFDGGASWQVVEVTHSSSCTGNPFWVRGTDPWVSFSPDGTAYFMHLGIWSLSRPLPATTWLEGMVVVRSTDGGLSWGEPTTLVLDASPSVFHDKNAITADPNDSDFVYAVWDKLSTPPSETEDLDAVAHARAFGGETIFTRSTDGGTSWEPIRTILDSGTRKQTIGNQIVVRPAGVGGELVNVFNLIFERSNAHGLRGWNAAVQISPDHGVTWSEPTVIAKMLPADTVDPDSGFPVRTGDLLPDAAVDPNNGNLFVVWHDARFSGGGYNEVALAMSGDGGRSWTAPVAVPRPLEGVAAPNRQAFTPQVHVSADGRLGVSYYDFRHNDGADGDTETDYYLSECATPNATEPDLCAGDWTETRVTAESFDLRQAPVANGLFLGDYVGLTDVPGAFAAAFSVSAAGDPASIYYSTVPFAP
jgi:hypothetical protein